MPHSRDASGTASTGQWFEEWFNHPLYLELYSHRDTREAALSVQTILSITGLDQKDPASVSILDIACGAGRHAIELARLGYCVTGNDLSPFLLEEARKEALSCSLQLHFTCCDMRFVPTDTHYDLVVQLFTSFGYFDSKEDDRLVIQKVFAALEPKGWYTLDLINPVVLAQTLVPQTRRESAELSVLEERAFVGDRITKTITLSTAKGEKRCFTESVRLYSKSEIVALLQEEGFAVHTITGNYQGDPFSEEESPRMMLICQKP